MKLEQVVVLLFALFSSVNSEGDNFNCTVPHIANGVIKQNNKSGKTLTAAQALWPNTRIVLVCKKNYTVTQGVAEVVCMKDGSWQPSNIGRCEEAATTSKNKTILALQRQLGEAAKAGNVKKLRQLLRRSDVDINWKYDLDSVYSMYKRRTPLIMAANAGHLATVRLLLDQGADINARDAEDRSALDVAIWRGKYKVATLLLDRGAVANMTDDGCGGNPLEYAVTALTLFKTSRFITLLLDHGVNNVNCKTKFLGLTPLMLAVRGVNAAPEEETTIALTQLVQHGADIEAKDLAGKTPLTHSVIYGENVVAARFLLQHGAYIDAEDKDGHTALFYATHVVESEKVAWLLAVNGADVNHRDNNGRTPFFGAVRWCKPATVRLLLDHGADVNAVDNYLATPLYQAVQGRNLENVRLLVNGGANVKWKISECDSILGHTKLNYEIYVFLLRSGARADFC